VHYRILKTQMQDQCGYKIAGLCLCMRLLVPVCLVLANTKIGASGSEAIVRGGCVRIVRGTGGGCVIGIEHETCVCRLQAMPYLVMARGDSHRGQGAHRTAYPLDLRVHSLSQGHCHSATFNLVKVVDVDVDAPSETRSSSRLISFEKACWLDSGETTGDVEGDAEGDARGDFEDL